jgi:hypothetical protein
MAHHHKATIITAETMRRLVEACLDDRLHASSSACVHDRARCQVAKGGKQLCVRLGPPDAAAMELVFLEGAVQCKRLANVVVQGSLPGDDGAWLRVRTTAAAGVAGDDSPFWLELQVPV